MDIVYMQCWTSAAVCAGSGDVFVLRGFGMAVGVISRFKDIFSVQLCTAYSWLCSLYRMGYICRIAL